MKKLVFAAFLLCTQPCFALLSPLNQSIEEIQAILHSSELQKQLPQGEQILQIQRLDKGYLVKTGQFDLFADIQYQQINRPGKQQFKVVFHQPIPRAQAQYTR